MNKTPHDWQSNRDLLNDLPCVETHISRVFLSDSSVFKIKKPVDFGFLDFRSLEQRRHFCEAEVRLNQRLSPDVYLGVVPVYAGREGGLTLAPGEDPVDWAVHMRRLPEKNRADTRLAQGLLSTSDIEAIAQKIARFHASARCDAETSKLGQLDVIERNLIENFEQLDPVILEYISREQKQEIENAQILFLAKNESAFRRRVESQSVRDGHGDLRLEHIYLEEDGSINIIDCIEFNDRFRFADTCADIAFLAMDLTWHGHSVLAERFLAAYAQASNDFHFYPLVDFYESYRAYVRGKISSFVAQDSSTDHPTRKQAAADARRYLLLSLAAARRRLDPPGLFAVGGAIASGKSTLAVALADELAAPVVDADRTRKWLLGVEASKNVHVPAFTGPYSEEASLKTYAEVMDRARSVLRSGRSVVLDASFRTSELRATAKSLASAESVPFHFLECRAPKEVLLNRLLEREKKTHVSDGRIEILDDFLARWQPVKELDEREHIVLDTTKSLEENVRQLRHRFGSLPQALS